MFLFLSLEACKAAGEVRRGSLRTFPHPSASHPQRCPVEEAFLNTL